MYERALRRQPIRPGALLVGMLLVLMAGVARAQFLSPGPLAQGHAKWEGDANCTTCHVAGKGLSNAKCTACHEPIGRSMNGRTGLHGRNYQGQACSKCHSDHRGRAFAMIRWNPATFHHDETGYVLRGAHAATKCSGCHKTKSYIGLSQACTSCHKDPHTNRFGANCLGCHDESAWTSLRLDGFDHALARFPLRGGHAKVACNECHEGSPPKYVGLEFSACTSCHQDPHRGSLGAACTNCHAETDWHSITFKTGAHPWLSLANGHSRAACSRCHDRGTLRAPSRGRACVGCHERVHEADFGNRCETCHASIQWLGLARSIGLSAHVKTSYPLAGEHQRVACASCHKPSVPEQQRYRGLAFARCDACHADVHEGRFARATSRSLLILRGGPRPFTQLVLRYQA